MRRAVCFSILTLVAGACSADADDAGAAAPAADVGAHDAATAPSDPGSSADPGPPTPILNCLLGDAFLNIAHRGGRLLAPEHTLFAYQIGLDAGADVLELDVRSTSDGVLVLLHDDSVDRTTDGTGKVSEMTWAEVEALDAGYTFTTDEGVTFPHRGTGLKVARLEDALDAFPGVCMTVELKQYEPSIVAPVLAAFAAHDAIQRAVFSSFDDLTLAAVREARPDAITGMGVAEMLGFALLDDSALATYQPPAPIAQAPKDQVTAKLVANAHQVGVKVHAWTVNDPAQMAELLEMGIDGIITDDPATLATIAADAGL